MPLPPEMIAVLAAFAPLFFDRVQANAQILAIGAFRATGECTVTSALAHHGIEPRGPLSESLEDQGRPDASGGDGGESSLGVSREQRYGPERACSQGQEGLESTVLLELNESSRRGDDLLSGVSVLAAVLADLEVGA
ncbi:MAG: hypothetical protein JO252_03020 [Planctomycetaceae bacterium]|nr:hypothetical protein [Planctomycetaceae bacterium]